MSCWAAVKPTNAHDLRQVHRDPGTPIDGAARRHGKTLVPGRQVGIQLLPPTTFHYVRGDSTPHRRAALCARQHPYAQDENARRAQSELLLKSRAQMEATFRPLIDPPPSVRHPAHRRNVRSRPEDPTYHLPDLPIPEGFTYATYLRHLTEQDWSGFTGKQANDPGKDVKSGELRIIGEMGFDVYFLIVADLCDFARSRNIQERARIGRRVAGGLLHRHHRAGSAQQQPDLRALPQLRAAIHARLRSDYPDDQREEMIRYTVEKYGS
ncbi:MAG: hypothetical protein R2856_25900 [Caldilineaceae bacterium]